MMRAYTTGFVIAELQNLSSTDAPHGKLSTGAFHKFACAAAWPPAQYRHFAPRFGDRATSVIGFTRPAGARKSNAPIESRKGAPTVPLTPPSLNFGDSTPEKNTPFHSMVKLIATRCVFYCENRAKVW